MAEGEMEWELSKENIQPLRCGRTMSALTQALSHQQEGIVSAINQQKQAYELELRLYDGDDPLDVWHRYIKWVEQTYPQGGKESNLTVLLERAVMKFTEEKRYYNDPRYVDLWIKFTQSCSDPLESYRYMQAQGIGTMQASFYIAWSEEYENRGNLRMADSIYQEGLKCGAEPLNKLHQYHKAVQARVCRQTMTLSMNQEPDDCPPEPQRASLAVLKATGKKKAVAPIDRVAGKVGHAKGLEFQQPFGPSQNSRLVIFDENKEHTELQELRETWAAHPTNKPKENEQKHDKWSNTKLLQKSRSGYSVVAPPPKPNFQPFVEESDQPPAVTPCKINPTVNTILSARKPRREDQTPLKTLQERQQHMQLQQEGEDKSGEKSMYCKQLLFSGVTEFSFEELRAERFRQKCNQKPETATGDTNNQEEV